MKWKLVPTASTPEMLRQFTDGAAPDECDELKYSYMLSASPAVPDEVREAVQRALATALWGTDEDWEDLDIAADAVLALFGGEP